MRESMPSVLVALMESQRIDEVEHILHFLPLTDVVHLSQVNRQWRQFLQSTFGTWERKSMVRTVERVKREMKLFKCTSSDTVTNYVYLKHRLRLGVVYGWGSQFDGELPFTSFLPQPIDQYGICKKTFTGHYTSFVITENNEMIANGCNYQGILGNDKGNDQTSEPSNGRRRFKFITSGKSTFAIDQHDRLWAWGDNKSGKLGHGEPWWDLNERRPKVVEHLRHHKIKCVSSGDSFATCVTTSGQLFTWGGAEFNGHGQGDLLLPTDMSDFGKIALVACGWFHTVVVSACGRLVWSFGQNQWGQLGLGDNLHRPKPTLVKTLSNKTIIKVAAGYNFSVVLTQDGVVWTWGRGVMPKQVNLLHPTVDISLKGGVMFPPKIIK